MSKLEQQLLNAYDLHADALYRFIYYKVRQDKNLAQDILQQTYMNAWKALGKKGEIEHMKAFLYRIARNLVIDHVRRQSRRIIMPLENPEALAAPSETHEKQLELIDKEMDLEKVRKLAVELPDKYIEVFELRFIEEMSIPEIANTLNITNNAVSIRIHRIIKQLTKTYEQNFQTA